MQHCYSLTVKSFKHVVTHNFISPNFCQVHFEEYLLIMDLVYLVVSHIQIVSLTLTYL